VTDFRMISRCGEGLALLLRLSREGYDVDFWVPPNVPEDLYEGLLPRVHSWRDGLDDETILLVDSPGSGKLLDSVQNKSWGAGSFNDVLQFDRQFGFKIARINALKVPQWQRFYDVEQAIRFLKDNDGLWNVELPNGQIFYERQSSESLIELLNYSQAVTDFYLIQSIDGAEITLQGWYVAGQLVPGTLFSTVEQRRFLSGDYGPRCAAQSCIAWFWRPKKKRDGETTPTIYRHTLKKLEAFLRQGLYSGPLSLRLRISKADGLPYFYGFETGFAHLGLYAMSEGLDCKWGILLVGLATDEMPPIQPSYDWLAGLSLSVPPYPYYAGTPNRLVRGPLDNEHVWPLDVKYVDDRHFTAGAHGVVAYITGRQSSRKQLAEQVGHLSEKIQIADKQMRTDAFDFEDTFALLKDWRYF